MQTSGIQRNRLLLDVGARAYYCLDVACILNIDESYIHFTTGCRVQDAHLLFLCVSREAYWGSTRAMESRHCSRHGHRISLRRHQVLAEAAASSVRATNKHVADNKVKSFRSAQKSLTYVVCQRKVLKPASRKRLDP